MMINLATFISNFPDQLAVDQQTSPWELIENIKEIIHNSIHLLDKDFQIKEGIAIHTTAIIEKGVTLKAPTIINAHVIIGANSYFREGVFLAKGVKVGPSSEIKSSIVCKDTAIAHMNYIGNSIIGSRVNFEAGSIAANHFNERSDKSIKVKYRNEIIETGLIKFGAIVGDDSKVGANAVLSPGTILERGSIIKRLELVEQLKSDLNIEP